MPLSMRQEVNIIGGSLDTGVAGKKQTVFEVEAILNDCPITKLSDDPNDLEPLMPNHILLMKGNPVLSSNQSQHN